MLLIAESICRIFYISPRVSLHLDGFGRVLCHLSGSTTSRGRTGFSRQIDLHTQVYGATSPEISINILSP